MKIVNIREARAGLSELIVEAQGEPVCFTRHGKPVAVLTGVEGADLGSVILENSTEFWDEIERRRKSGRPRKTLEQVRAKLIRAKRATMLKR
jgi:prevent-host-death family protein